MKIFNAFLMLLCSVFCNATTFVVNTTNNKDLYGNHYGFVVNGSDSYAYVDASNTGYQSNVIVPDSVIYGKAKLPVKEISDWAYTYGDHIKSLTISGTVERCLRDCFGGLNHLSSITFEYGDEPLNFSSDYVDDPNYGDPLFHEVPIKELYIDRNWTIPSITFAYDVYTLPPFKGNVTLESIVIGNSVKSIHDIEFRYCSNLKYIKLGSGLTTIGQAAFYDCNNIERIEILATTPPSFNETNPFSSTVYLTAQLIVPKGTKELYSMSLGWSNFMDIVETENAGISDTEISDEIVSIYSVLGIKLNELQQGLNIVKYKSGKIEKVLR